MKRIQKRLQEITLISLLMFFFSCANIVAPTGGPSDRTPPKAMKSSPPAFSPRFSEQRINIKFDEFVTINDATNQIVISPPLKEMPEIKLKGKSVVVDFADTLASNTTYTIYFGKAIQDLNEGNILQDFRYVFSTGGHIDSMTVRGSIRNAYTTAAEKGVYVMLYRDDQDSVPYKKLPDYLSKTNEAGFFEISNVSPGRYKVFALKDVNSNLIYDQPNEMIAFYDSLANAQYIPPVITDTTSKKPGSKDSIDINREDSLKEQQRQIPVKMVNLVLFEERDTTQKLLKSKSDKTGRLDFYFRWPVTDLQIRNLKKSSLDNWKTDEYNASRDTLICWLSNPEADTLLLEVSDRGKILDTVELISKGKTAKPAQKNKSGKGNAGEEAGFTLSCLPGYGGTGMQDFFRPLQLVFNHPLREINKSSIILREKKDSVYIAVTPELNIADSLIKRHLLLNYSWKPKTSYELFIPPATMTDIYGLVNDTIKFRFTTSSPDTYGRLKLKVNIADLKFQYVIQLVNESNIIQMQQVVREKTTLEREHLLPGKYGVRAFCDRNSNGIWDTGNYLMKKKPEEVYYYPAAITIKANWDTDLTWEL